MDTTNISIPPGQYSAGSIQVRAIDGDNTSELRPLGPMISPYTPTHVNITMLNSSEDKIVYGVSGIGQIGATVEVEIPGDSTTFVSDVVDKYGHFQLIIEYPLDESEPDTTPLQGVTLIMRDPDFDNNNIISEAIPLDRAVATYTFILGDIPEDNTVNIVPATTPIIYSLDGGNTWSDRVDSTDPIPIPEGLYPPGMIRIRALDDNDDDDDDEFPSGPSYSVGGTISPYVISELNITTTDIGDPAITSWVITGTGDIGSAISLVNSADPDSPIEGIEVGPYGRFTITIPVASLNPNNSYSLTMINSSTGLETSRPLDIPNLTPPETSYVLNLDPSDPSEPPVVEISVVDDGRTIEYTLNGGLKWNSPPQGP